MSNVPTYHQKRRRRVVALLIAMLVFIVACGGGSAAVPTLAPRADLGDAAQQSRTANISPRTDSDGGLPPTWTPAPQPEPATRAPEIVVTEAALDQETYIVQAGDTLAELAEQFGVTLDDLVSANGIDNIDLIEVGQVLIIPR